MSLRFDREWKTGWAFALPGLSLLAIVMGFPLVYAAVMAVSSLTLLHPHLLPLTGWANFASILGDPGFRHALWLTFGYSFVTVAGEFGLGLGVALMLNRVVALKPVYFAILTIPMAMSPVSVGLIWRMLLQPNLGIVNACWSARACHASTGSARPISPSGPWPASTSGSRCPSWC